MRNKKKILLVSSAFYPEISPRSFRATELAAELARQGHKVTIYTKYRDFDYSEFLNENKLLLRMWGKTWFPAIPELKGEIAGLISRALRRLLQLLFEYPDVEETLKVKRALRKEDGFDLCISIALPYPVHWGVAWSRTKNHPITKIWIADCGDPYMLSVLDTFKKLFYFKYLEKWFCRKADFITIPIESAKKGYYREFHHKIRIIPQGFDFDISNRNTDISLNEIPKFAYAGQFIPGFRDPRPLLQFLSSVSMPFKFFVFTEQPDLLSGFVKPLKGKLFISKPIPRSELMSILSEMDFLINIDNNTSVHSPPS